MSFYRMALSLGLSWAAALSSAHAASQPIPPAPEYYVLDEPGLLTPQQQKALATMLIEHDDATGEQIVVAVFKTLGGEAATSRTHEIFEQWQVGKRGQDNGDSALYAKEHTARIEAGYGLDTRMGDAEIRKILHDFLVPELHAGHAFRALGLSMLEILRSLESPLIETGRAEELLQIGGLQGSLKPVTRGPTPGSWWLYVLFGAAFADFRV